MLGLFHTNADSGSNPSLSLLTSLVPRPHQEIGMVTNEHFLGCAELAVTVLS